MTSKEAIARLKGNILSNPFDRSTEVNLNDLRIVGSQMQNEYLEELNTIEKDLEEKEYYEKIKLMLKQKESALRYIESEDCFAVRCILDDKWYKLTDDLIKNNIKEEVKPMPLIDKIKELKEKVERQDKILEILKKHISFKLDERQCDKYLIKMVSEDTGNYTYIRLYEEEVKKLLEEWLDNEH